MKPPKPNQLLHEVLGNTTVESLRQDSLAALLVVLRRRRTARRTGAACAFVCFIGLAAWLLAPRFDGETAAYRKQIPPPPASANLNPSLVKQISDAELLALFPGQTVALIGPPGKQQFLVFAEAVTQ